MHLFRITPPGPAVSRYTPNHDIIFKSYPDPGFIPDKPSPKDGEVIHIAVEGLPPYKDISQSIRYPKHPHYNRFINLRKTAFVSSDKNRYELRVTFGPKPFV